MSLEIFRSSKEKQRQSFFKTVKNKSYHQRILLKTSPYNKTVTVTVGLVERDDTDLKYIRGKRLPVKVSDKCSAAELKEAAIEKHSKYDQEICALKDYVLLYPDFKEVLYLPGSSNAFQLDKYKHDLAKPYLQILFYLCMLLHFEKGQPSSGKKKLSPKKPELPSIKEGDDLLFDEFADFYSNLETIDLSIPSSNCSVVSSSDKATSAQHMVYQPPPRDTNEELLGISNEDLPEIFNLLKSEPSKSAFGDDSAESEDVKLLTYAEKLKKLSSIFKSHESVEICVRRRRIWEDSVQTLKRLFKDGIKPFHIRSVGEKAVDHGGQFKEYFTLLFDEAKHQLLCTGGNLGFTFLHDIQKLKNGEFYLFRFVVLRGHLEGMWWRKMLFALSCAEYFLRNIYETEDEFQSIVDTFPERFGFVATKFVISFTEKSGFIQQITQHFCFSMCSEEIQDFNLLNNTDFIQF